MLSKKVINCNISTLYIQKNINNLLNLIFQIYYISLFYFVHLLNNKFLIKKKLNDILTKYNNNKIYKNASIYII